MKTTGKLSYNCNRYMDISKIESNFWIQAFISVNVYCPHNWVPSGYVQNHTVVYLVILKMDILQCKCITLLNVTLTMLVAHGSWERSNYKLVEFLILRSKSHKVIVKSLVSGARLWGKVSDLPGLLFLIYGKRSHSIGRIKWINTKCSKNQTANMLL